MIDENPDLAFVHPEEGVNFFIDSMCIPANAKHQEAAEMFINYLCEPDVGLANADFIGYSTPITAVWEMLDDDLKYSEIAYPSAEVLDKAEVFETLPDDINAAMDAQWSEMKSYEDGRQRLDGSCPAASGHRHLCIQYLAQAPQKIPR